MAEFSKIIVTLHASRQLTEDELFEVHQAAIEAIPEGVELSVSSATIDRLPDTRQTSAAASDSCRRPPAGWHCTRGPGHDGPCAAHPINARITGSGGPLSEEDQSLLTDVVRDAFARVEDSASSGEVDSTGGRS